MFSTVKILINERKRRVLEVISKKCKSFQHYSQNSEIYYDRNKYITLLDRLCGLVVRLLGYRSGGPGSIPGTTKKK
jgi:hypothetical protein